MSRTWNGIDDRPYSTHDKDPESATLFSSISWMALNDVTSGNLLLWSASGSPGQERQATLG